MWTTKITKTFSFKKLANNWEDIVRTTKTNIRDNAIVQFKRNIDTQGNPIEGKFAKLSPKTIKRRVRSPFTHTPPSSNILKDTGKLYNSIRPIGNDTISAAGHGLRHIYGTMIMPIRDWSLLKQVLPKKERKIIMQRIAKAWKSAK